MWISAEHMGELRVSEDKPFAELRHHLYRQNMSTMLSWKGFPTVDCKASLFPPRTWTGDNCKGMTAQASLSVPVVPAIYTDGLLAYDDDNVPFGLSAQSGRLLLLLAVCGNTIILTEL